MGEPVGGGVQFRVSRLPCPRADGRAQRVPGHDLRETFGKGLFYVAPIFIGHGAVDFAGEILSPFGQIQMGRRWNRQKAVKADKFKQHPRRLQRSDPARKPAAPDRKAVRRGGFKVDFLKPCPPEKFPNHRDLLAALVHDQVPVPGGPAARPAEHGQALDQTGDIFVAQMTEKTGKQNEVSRHRARIIASQGGVGFKEMELPSQAGLFRRRLAPRDGFRVVLNE